MKQALDLRQLRRSRGWSQVETARKLRVSQPYLSLLERGQREITSTLSRRLLRTLDLSPSFLPLPASLSDWGEVRANKLARRLAALGYEPLAYLQSATRPENPAAVLLWALSADNLEARLVEALPWLLLRFADMKLDWLVSEAKVRDLQNRLGFVGSLAKDVAARDQRYQGRYQGLKALERQLDHSRLAREDTLCDAAMSTRMREALRRTRSTAAVHWNLLTGWAAEHLSYD